MEKIRARIHEISHKKRNPLAADDDIASSEQQRKSMQSRNEGFFFQPDNIVTRTR